MKKRNLMLAGAIVMIMGMSGCGNSGEKLEVSFSKTEAVQATTTEKAEATETTEDITEEETTVETTTEEVTEEPTSEENIVRVQIGELCHETGTYNDGYNDYNYSYILPKIEGADTQYIQTVNSEIQGIYNSYIKEELSNMQQKLSLVTLSCGYDVYSKNGINSIAIYMYNDWGCNAYYCYNFDDAGNEITNSALISSFGISEDAFISDIKSRVESYKTEGLDLSQFSAEDKQYYQETVTKTLSDDNINMNMKLFVLSGDRIGCVVTVYSIAGADSYDYRFIYNEGVLNEY